MLVLGNVPFFSAIHWRKITRRQDTTVAFNYFGANHRLDEEAIILSSVKFNVFMATLRFSVLGTGTCQGKMSMGKIPSQKSTRTSR